MIRIAICDDEEYFLNELKHIIEEYTCMQKMTCVIDSYYSGKELVEMGEGICSYDIVFLDISMKDLDGMSVARRIREMNKNIFIVFVTAFAAFLAEGYKVDAIRYILKNIANLSEAVCECMDAIQDKMHYAVVLKEYHFTEGRRKVSLENLMYVESRLHRLDFYFLQNETVKYTIYMTLNELEEELSGYGFLRIHQSYLVNLKYVKQLMRYKVVLNNGISLAIPKARYKEVEESYIEYKGEF